MLNAGKTLNFSKWSYFLNLELDVIGLVLA